MQSLFFETYLVKIAETLPSPDLWTQSFPEVIAFRYPWYFPRSTREVIPPPIPLYKSFPVPQYANLWCLLWLEMIFATGPTFEPTEKLRIHSCSN